MNQVTPLVSVCVITYNHEKYILDALNGILIQKTDFPIEIVVSNDASTDSTDELISKFIRDHPELSIRYTNHAKNIGMIDNLIYTLKNCSGKYIAMCEGDDYWTDEHKLQCQVDFLEKNSDYSICFHRVIETVNEIAADYNLNKDTEECDITFEKLAEANVIHTPSVIFKNQLKIFPSWFKFSPIGDYVLWMMLAEKGKIHYFPDEMAIYRRGVGCWSSNYHVINVVKWTQVLCFLKDYFSHNEKIYSLLDEQLKRNTTDAKFILDQDQSTISKQEETIQKQEETIQKQEEIIQSAKNWQKRSLIKRIFHKWRPVHTPQQKLHFFKKLERSIRKRRNYIFKKKYDQHNKPLETKSTGIPTVIVPFKSRLARVIPPERIAVVLHIYYQDQANYFLKALQAIPNKYSLYISTDTNEKLVFIKKIFTKSNAEFVDIRLVPNVGRDIAPKLVSFKDVYDKQDLILFLHSKLSLHCSELSNWRDYIMKSLLGSKEIVESILDAFSFAKDLGIIAPPNLPFLRQYINWGSNYENCSSLAKRMGLMIATDSPIDFPAGSMFWARPAAIQALLDAQITIDDFPTEKGQTDTTFAHAVERLFFYSCELAGLRWIHAGTHDQLSSNDLPIHVTNPYDFERALSDQMPSLILPGIRPHIHTTLDKFEYLSDAKKLFRTTSTKELSDFLASNSRLSFNSSETPKVSIILILFNQAELTFHCLQSLKKNAELPIEIIILDNGSTDNTSRLLDQLDGVKIIQNNENLHFLRGVNRAAKDATAEYLLLLNNDTRVLTGTIPAAVQKLDEDDSIGAVGGSIVLLDGSLQEAGSIIFNDGSCLGYGRGRDPGEPEFKFSRDVDYCSGAFLMMSLKLWQNLGGFDEAFVPAYYEETDLCMRIWANGKRVVYDPNVKIVHFEFASSASNDSAIQLQVRNSETFKRKHAKALQLNHQSSAVPIIQARQRRNSSPRILVIDDRVPLPSLGSGYPRAACMVSEISKAGWSATLFPVAYPYFSCSQSYEILPITTEFIEGEPITSLANFLNSRHSCYDCILVSRPHNMMKFIKAMDQISDWKNIPILYDAEAIFARRDAMLAELNNNNKFNYKEALEAELQLCRGVKTIFSVSEIEAEIFRNNGCSDVHVLGHSLIPRPLGNGPESRKNMLFVGALDDEKSPNTDSLNWFVNEIMPLIDQKIGTNWNLEVAGRSGAKSLNLLHSKRVRILGKVDNLDPYYANARIFIAPTRYAAGIPMKVHEAACVGLPTVATDLLAKQLGWKHEQEIMCATNPEDYANHCIKLYYDDVLWMKLRSNALNAIERDNSPEKFRNILRSSLDDILKNRNI